MLLFGKLLSSSQANYAVLSSFVRVSYYSTAAASSGTEEPQERVHITASTGQDSSATESSASDGSRQKKLSLSLPTVFLPPKLQAALETALQGTVQNTVCYPAVLLIK